MLGNAEWARRQVAYGILARLRLKRLARRFQPTTVLAAFNFVNGGLSIGILSVVALATGEPFIFPSLGATAFILFYAPLMPPASPRNTVIGHLFGVIAGWTGLIAFGLVDAPSAMANSVEWTRVGAAAVSLGVVGALMIYFSAAHPPAGATALIISLGLMPHLHQIPILMGAVVLLVLQAYVMNRIAGIPYPKWTCYP